MTAAELPPDFRALFESTSALLLALEPDAPRYTVIAVSDAYLRATATKREEILGRGLLEVFPRHHSGPRAPETQDLRASLQTVLRARASDAMTMQRYDVPRQAKDGGGFEERWWRPVNAPVMGPKGELACIVCCIDDVTEFVRLEQAAAEREQQALAAQARLASLLEQAPDGIYVGDADGRYTDVNEVACRMLGYSRAEMIGKTVFDFIPPEDVERVRHQRAQLARTGALAAELRLRRKDGSLVPVELSAKLLSDGRRQGIVRDISERKRIETQLQRLATILRDSSDAITLQDLNGSILAWNRGAERMFGYSEVEALRMNIAGLNPDGDKGTFDYLRAIARGEEVPPREVQRRTKDGRILDVWLTTTRVVENGRPVAVATIARDVTLQNQRERERLLEVDALERLYKVSSLFLTERRSQAVFDEMLEAAIAVTGADFGNIQLLDPSGSGLRIVAHHGFPDWWLEYWRHVPEGQGACGTALERGERMIVEDITQSPIFAGTEMLEIQLRAGIRAVQSTPLFSRSGVPLGMISTHYQTPRRPPERALRLLDLFARRTVEIIERLRIETALRRSEAKASGILMTAVEAIISIDEGRHITEWNKGAETIFGYSRAEALGARLDMLIPERYVDDHRQHVARFAAEAEVARRMDHDDAVGLRKNGEEFPISAKISKLVIDGERIMTVSVRDTGAERRILDELRRAIQARDEVLAIVAHDLRNPLNSIVLQSQLFRRRGPEPDRRSQKPAEAIVHAASRMNRIIADLLDVTRLDAGRFAIEREPTPGGEIVAAVVEAQRPLVAARSLELRLDLAERLPKVLADTHRVYQVFENLVGNAMKFTASGSITIGARPGADEVLFWVADTGSGIPPEQKPHLFERFWQAQKTTRSGAGLGLPIVNGIIEAHGGRVWVESQAGAGSTFFFTLPIATQAAPALAAAPAEAGTVPSEVRRPTPTVLLAEDDPDVREALAEALWSDGYEVVAVANGAEALEQLRRAPPPKSVILDLSMPVVDGWSFLAARNGDPTLRAIPVIVLSAQPDVDERVRAAHARHIQKPVLVDRLLEMMKESDPAAAPGAPTPPPA